MASESMSSPFGGSQSTVSSPNSDEVKHIIPKYPYNFLLCHHSSNIQYFQRQLRKLAVLTDMPLLADNTIACIGSYREAPEHTAYRRSSSACSCA